MKRCQLKLKENESYMISDQQSRAARGLLNLTQSQLAEATGLSVVTVSAFEKGGDMRASNNQKIQAALEAAGVEFIPENGGGAGVRLRKA